ncbi:MAG: endonuclease/exonuclease/phosphatase family protein [Arachnia sp.]
MSANLWNLNEPLTRRMALLSDAIERLRPDVIALQEVRPLAGTRARMQLELIPALADYHLTTCMSLAWDDGAEGLAVATRVRPDETCAYRLPGAGHEFEPDRAAQYVRIAWGDGSLGVLNTHLAYHPTSEALRVSQASFVGAVAGELAEARPDDGLVVCGDLNARPASEPVARLRALGGLDNPLLALSEEKNSYAAANPYVGGDPDADSWLDYILTRNVTASGARLIDDWPDGPASDHYFPVLEVAPLPRP